MSTQTCNQVYDECAHAYTSSSEVVFICDRNVQERMTLTSVTTADCSNRLNQRLQMTVGHIVYLEC